MAPHIEKYEGGDDDGEGATHSGFWDWWQIGGRYTGSHTPDYDPEMDPRNVEKCDLCHGTGFRRDVVGRAARELTPSYTCNGCGECKDGKWTHGKLGAGKRTKWPTSWAPSLGDVIPADKVTPELSAFTLIVGDRVIHQEEWNGTDWVPGSLKDKNVKAVLDELGISDGYLVTVDYHC
jgi:hypothetical protein